MRLFGHPIHPVLVHFPIAFWTLATLAYVGAVAGFDAPLVAVAKFANAGGLLMAVPAMAAGVLEYRSIDVKSEAFRIATSHLMLMASAWTLFLAGLLLPLSPSIAPAAAGLAAAIASVIGFLLLSVGGWLGGRLVYEFGTGMKVRVND